MLSHGGVGEFADDPLLRAHDNRATAASPSRLNYDRDVRVGESSG